MTKFEKSYIEKGKKVQGMNIVKVTLQLGSCRKLLMITKEWLMSHSKSLR